MTMQTMPEMSLCGSQEFLTYDSEHDNIVCQATQATTEVQGFPSRECEVPVCPIAIPILPVAILSAMATIFVLSLLRRIWPVRAV